jgi:hypothetical protein
MRTSNLILVMVGLLVLFLLKDGCNRETAKDALLAQLKNNEQVFKVKISKDSSTIATQTQTIMSERDAHKAGILKLQNEIQIPLKNLPHLFKFLNEIPEKFSN